MSESKSYHIEIEELLSGASSFYQDLLSDTNGRYRSWEYCYEAFSEARKCEVDDEAIDKLCLHLSFYLASWGMYRGSSFLLQKDYKVHREVIITLLSPEYDALCGIECNNYDERNIELLFRLIGEISKSYDVIRKDVKRTNKSDDVEASVSYTLVSKVLLGTLGCIPAYDRYFIKGVKDTRVAVGSLSRKSIRQLCDYYKEHHEEFEGFRSQTQLRHGRNYPQMKIIDMAFWNLAFKKELAQKSTTEE